jgi:homoserine acetyltransferase
MGRWRLCLLSNYQDMFFDPKANDLCADYIKRKIRSTVKDPRTAEKLIPKGRHTGGDLRAALGRVKAKTFVMPMSSDMFFSPADCQGRVEAPNPMPNFGRFRPSMGILRYLVLIRMR